MISIQMSDLDRIIAGLDQPIVNQPVDLQPTGYCTETWNGHRCDGNHGNGFHSWTDPEAGKFGRMWYDGCGGIGVRDTLYELHADADFSLDWSALEDMRADEMIAKSLAELPTGTRLDGRDERADTRSWIADVFGVPIELLTSNRDVI